MTFRFLSRLTMVVFLSGMLTLSGCQQDDPDPQPDPPPAPAEPTDNGDEEEEEEPELLPVSGAEPDYERSKWRVPEPPPEFGEWTREQRARWINTPNADGFSPHYFARLQVNNNCYNYACNKPNRPDRTNPGNPMPPPAVPGRAGGYTPPNGWCRLDAQGREVATNAQDPKRGLCNADMTCAVVMAGARTDGLVSHDCDTACPGGSYKKALVLDPLTAAERQDAANDVLQSDWHWLRQDGNGKWSWKAGESFPFDVTPGDADGNGVGEEITDPRDAKARSRYTEFCGCFCCGANVRKAGLDLERYADGLLSLINTAHAQPAMDNSIRVVRLTGSGRANFHWQITDPVDVATIITMLQGLPSAAEADETPYWEGAYLLDTTDNAPGRDVILFPLIRVHDGTIDMGGRYFKDVNGLEQWLADRDPSQASAP